jgi:hypothetical protein
MLNKKDHSHQSGRKRHHPKSKPLRSGFVPGTNPNTVVHPLRASLFLIARIAAAATPTKDNREPALGIDSSSKVPSLDYASANPYWVRELGQHLDVIVGLCQNGSRALGHLLAVSSAELEGGEISGDTVEGLGWLLSELGDVGAWATVMAQSCKAATADFCPPDRHV